MVRGNWQKRVEKAQERRKESKQRKQRRDCRGLYKNLVQNHLLRLLDRYNDEILFSSQEAEDGTSRNKFVNIWTDVAPASRAKEKIIDDHTRKSKKSDTAAGGRGGERNNNTPKKAHPRSNVSTTPPENKVHDKDNEESLLLCKQHFFMRKCSLSQSNGEVGKKGKKGDGISNFKCPFEHYCKKSGQKTLADVLLMNTDLNPIVDSKGALKSSLEAAAAAYSDIESNGNKSEMKKQFDENGSIEMIYHLAIGFNPSDLNVTERSSSLDCNNYQEKKVGIIDIISKALSKESCPIASIVYLEFKNTLVFDRYRGGIVLTEEQEHRLFYGGDGLASRRFRSSSITSQNSAGNRVDHECVSEEMIIDHLLDALPGPVLEHILTFLPDKSVGLLPMVCRGWSQEIGITSPAIWKYYMLRRRWPMPKDSDMIESSCKEVSERDTHRNMFVSHYIAVQKLNNIQKGIQHLLSGIHNVDKSVSILKFNDLDDRQNHTCSRLRLWSKSIVIAAFRHDCTVRLFEAVASGNGLLTKQTICSRVAPFAKSKRLHCYLKSMDLDDDFVMCSFDTDDGHSLKSHWITTIERDDLLCTSGSSGKHDLDDGVLKIFDINEFFSDYLSKNLDNFHNSTPERLYEYLYSGGDDSKIELSIGENIECCGQGRVMFLADILLPSDDFDEGDSPITVAKCLILFSTIIPSITWIKYIPEFMIPMDSHLLLSSYREQSSRKPTSLVVTSSQFAPILQLNVGKSGDVVYSEVDDELVKSRNQMMFESWQLSSVHPRQTLVTPSGVTILTDDLICRERSMYRVVLTFVSKKAKSNQCAGKVEVVTLGLENCLTVLSMHYAGSDHIFLKCISFDHDVRRIEDEDDQWFDDSNFHGSYNVDISMIHVPSKQEMHRYRLYEYDRNFPPVAMTLTSSPSIPGTIAASMDSTGLILTGHDVKSLVKYEDIRYGATPTENGSSKKKKKKKNQKGKKDGFARGMSLRG